MRAGPLNFVTLNIFNIFLQLTLARIVHNCSVWTKLKLNNRIGVQRQGGLDWERIASRTWEKKEAGRLSDSRAGAAESQFPVEFSP